MTTYLYGGFAFGHDTDFPLALPQIAGLEGFRVRTGNRELPRGHGDIPGNQYVAARPMTAPFVVARDSRAALEAAVAELRAAFPPEVTDEQPLTIAGDGHPDRVVYCRPQELLRGDTRLGLRAEPVVTLMAADPRIYSATERAVTVPLYATGGGGLDYPLDYPKDYAPGVQLEATAANDGTADAYPVVRFYGPATTVTLTNTTTGQTVEIVTPLSAGQILVADFHALAVGNGGQVVGIEGSSRYGAWTRPRAPFALPPGDSLLRFTAVGSAATTTAVVTYRDTWLS